MFDEATDYRYSERAFLLGTAPDSNGSIPIGVKTQRHAITIAGSRAGKGVAVIIPNLRKWQANALVIDPKGEAVNATAKIRQEMGQTVHVIDPFNSCKEWTHKATYNPLDTIDVNSETAREDILVIADGIVLRNPNDDDSHWDEGAMILIASIIAIVCLTRPPEQRNLISVRAILSNVELLEKTMLEAQTMEGCGNLPQNGAKRYIATEGGYFVSNAEKHTAWLDSPSIQRVFKSSNFSLSELKDGNTTVFLVLKPKYLDTHGRYLRIMVRCSLNVMMSEGANGQDKNKQCLFMLDEFFALGKIKTIQVSAGLMAGYGLQLWPILQDLGQLEQLYGRDGAQTFFGNSDVHQFFGNMDTPTLDYISQTLGVRSGEDVVKEYREWEIKPDDSFFSTETSDTRKQAMQSNSVSMEVLARDKGQRRLQPEEVAQIVGNLDDGSPISKRQITFVPGRKALHLDLLPFWEMDGVQWQKNPIEEQPIAPPSPLTMKKFGTWLLAIFCVLGLGIIFVGMLVN